ncbi:MAG: amino acid racemase [Candidatus Daviesbacteria bacterium]|nr:amino acid racemase [Candidatus Daviesbacteria bacterium]
MKTIGIIGGLGPETTSEFYLDIVFSCQKKDKTARPSVVIASVPLPYQIEEDSISKNIGIERCLPFLISEAKRLEKAGADFIVMPCNSLHIFIADIRNAVKVPVLSIVEETVKFLKKNNFNKVGIVSTSATIENKLYENAFKENAIAYETPDDFQQAKLGKFILNLVTGQQNTRDRDELIKIISDFESKNVDCVVLACTDLQLLIPKHPNLKIFDTMKIFADASVEEILKNNL